MESIREKIKCARCHNTLSRWQFEELTNDQIILHKCCHKCRNRKEQKTPSQKQTDKKTAKERTQKHFEEYQKIYFSHINKGASENILKITAFELVEYTTQKTITTIFKKELKKMKYGLKGKQEISNQLEQHQKIQDFLHEHKEDFLYLATLEDWPSENLPQGHSPVLVGRGERNNFDSIPDDMEAKILLVPEHKINKSPRAIYDPEKFKALA